MTKSTGGVPELWQLASALAEDLGSLLRPA